METGFIQPQEPQKKDSESSFKETKFKAPKITSTIGRGEDAKNSLIYLTLKWSFITGVIISIFVILNNWVFRVDEKVPDFMDDIKITWGLIVPIITLALGYAFGKSQNNLLQHRV
jgi:hypothetical protein